MNSLLLDALNCRNRSRPPIWLMRQAGRYMPEYRQIRSKYSFLEMCHTPELAAEITLLPIRAFGFDAAILFSDILVIPEALNMGLHFEEKAGPIIDKPVETPSDIEALPFVNMQEALNYVEKAIRLLTPQLNVPLLGFAGAPFTVASYMIEGKSSRDLKKTKQWMVRDPGSFHKLLGIITEHTISYLKMQLEAGVQAVQLFDSWANVLSHSHFREFSLAYMEKIIKSLKNTPVILFCKGSSVFAPQLAELSPAAISLDWNADISLTRKLIPQTIALQGNLDPDILYAPPSVIQKETKRILKGMQKEPGYIFNLGHGILPDTPVDSVKTLVATVQESS